MSELRVVATGLCFPEGPVAMRDGSIVLVEIERQTVSRVLPDGTVQVIARTGGGPNGLAVGPDGAFYVCNNGGFAWRLEENLFRPAMASSDYIGGRIERVDPNTGAVRVLYDHCGANKLNGPNDIVFDAHGGFYFTDLGKTRARDRDNGVIYYALADGSKIVEVAYPVADPERHRPVAGRHGALRRRDRAGAAVGVRHHRARRGERSKAGRHRMAAGWSSGLGGFQRFDSLAVEAAGNICVATLITGCISVIAPDGRLVRRCDARPGHHQHLLRRPRRDSDGRQAGLRSRCGASWVYEDAVLEWAGSVDQGSEHPLAAAIVRAARARGLALDQAMGFESSAGIGVRATVRGRAVASGMPP